jgi:hypothetical protein
MTEDGDGHTETVKGNESVCTEKEAK